MSNKRKTIQYNPLNFPVYVMTKAIGSVCNLKCSYCYYSGKSSNQPASQTSQMSDELLEIFTRQYIHSQPGENVLFTWHGGEPLLAGIDFYRKALHYQKIYAEKKTVDNVLQTNGILLTDEWCRFFKEHHFLIGISLDGPAHCHNQYRRFYDQRGTFTKVMEAVEKLKSHHVEFNILSVVNDYNVKYPLEVYRFFKSTGARYIQFSPVVERTNNETESLLSPQTGEGTLTSWSVDALGYGKFLTAIFDEWVKNDVGKVYVTTFDATLAGYLNVLPGTCIYAETCGHASALESNGDLYSCDHYVFDQNYLGNIQDKTIVEMMLSTQQNEFGNDKHKKLSAACKACTYLHLCHGECPKNRIIKQATDDYPQNYLCEGLKHYFAHTEPYMQYMANEIRNDRAPSTIIEALKYKHLQQAE